MPNRACQCALPEYKRDAWNRGAPGSIPGASTAAPIAGVANPPGPEVQAPFRICIPRLRILGT